MSIYSRNDDNDGAPDDSEESDDSTADGSEESDDEGEALRVRQAELAAREKDIAIQFLLQWQPNIIIECFVETAQLLPLSYKCDEEDDKEDIASPEGYREGSQRTLRACTSR